MKKIENIVILAGGDGDRFWPLKEKFLMTFLGKPFLEHMLQKLIPWGENMYVIGSRANKDALQEIAKGRAGILIQENGGDGMAGAVLACKGTVHGTTLIIGNDYIDFDILEKFMQKLESSDAELVFLAKKTNSVYFPGGYLQLEGSKLLGLIEKPEPSKVPSDLVRLVVDCFRDIDQFIDFIQEVQSSKDDRYERAMNQYIKKGQADYVEYEGFWQALKYPWHLLPMNRLFLASVKESHIDETAKISSNAHIEGTVHIGRNCKIGEFVKIAGPCYIGDDSVVGDYSLVRESYLGNGVLVGSGCEVARSYVGESSSLHRNYIGDSILGPGVLFGAGAVTANFRFDQRHVFSLVGERRVDTDLPKFGSVIGPDAKVGVNVTLYPGVKVGPASFISPGEIVSADVPERTFISNGQMKQNKL